MSEWKGKSTLKIVNTLKTVKFKLQNDLFWGKHTTKNENVSILGLKNLRCVFGGSKCLGIICSDFCYGNIKIKMR